MAVCEILTGQKNNICCTCTELAHSRVQLSTHSIMCKGVASVFKRISSFLLFIFYAYHVSAGVSRSGNGVRVPERFPPESSWCDVSGREHVLAWRLLFAVGC